MVDCRLFVIFFGITLFISVLHAERARNDDLEDDFIDDNEYVIETIKRFLTKKKTTTTTTPSSGAISALITATPKGRTIFNTTRSSIYDPFGKKTKSIGTTTSRYGRTRVTSGPRKDGCGFTNPCKNGGTCKTLSSGTYYCFCGQDYYGKNCENKFITSGKANLDRTRKDHCASYPCRNSGECVGLRTTYYCRCKTPYYGINCDKKFTKREEIIDESNESEEQDLIAYERDLEDDTEDLRRALNNENY